MHLVRRMQVVRPAPGPRLMRRADVFVRRRKLTRQLSHHTLHWLVRTIGVPALQENACWNSGMFEITLLTRYFGIECGFVNTAVRINSERYCSHHENT